MNSEFYFSEPSCLTKAEEPSLPYYLPIARGRIIGFIPFPRVLVLCEMQSVSSRIWTRVAVSISYDDNHYTTGGVLPFPKDAIGIFYCSSPLGWYNLVSMSPQGLSGRGWKQLRAVFGISLLGSKFRFSLLDDHFPTKIRKPSMNLSQSSAMGRMRHKVNSVAHPCNHRVSNALQ